MSDPQIILDYARPPRSLGRAAADFAMRALTYARWFVLRRPLQAVEVFVGGWLLVSAVWVVQAIECERRGFVFTPVLHRASFPGELFPIAIGALVCAILIVAVAAFLRLAARRKWRAIAIGASVAMLSGIASGILQYDRCPHATYLQVLAVSIPVAGDACGNSREIEPWWLRE